uniref:Serpentine receptor class gamma n=1 Tax=Heterorhabditis bacteriophora TaxID=37862 RepID=A0A1I7XRH6_HETBA
MREDWFEIVSTSFALLFGFPSIILCICFTKAVCSGNSSLNTPFFNIFMIAGINDIAVFILNLLSTRLPGTGLFNPTLNSISSGPIPTTIMFLFYLASHAQIYGALIITLNRFTAVAFPTLCLKVDIMLVSIFIYNTYNILVYQIWSRISVPCVIMMFVLPIAFCWKIAFHGAVFELYDHPFAEFFYNKPTDQNYISKGVNVTYSIVVVSFINLAFNLGSLGILFHRRKKKQFIKSQKVEFHLYITTLVLFALQILIAIQQKSIVTTHVCDDDGGGGDDGDDLPRLQLPKYVKLILKHQTSNKCDLMAIIMASVNYQ